MGQVRYHVEKVPELPPGNGGAPRARYRTLLSPVMADPGNWFVVATYPSAGGAAVVRRKMEKNTITIPEGKWEFASRVVQEEDGKVSQLYARYMGAE